MSTAEDDNDASIGLVIGAHRRLSTLDKNHPLLAYVHNVTDQGFSYPADQELRKKFLDRYAPEERCPTYAMLGRYFMDLKKVADEIQGIKSNEPPQADRAATDLTDELPF